MANTVTIMAWNLENFGVSKYTGYGKEYVRLIAAVIKERLVDLAGFCELRSNLGSTIGNDLINELNNWGGAGGANWRFKESPQLGAGRWEQYLFVWDSNKFTTYAPYFQSNFPNPAPPPANFGFPRQHTTSVDRPPFLGHFRFVAGTKFNFPIAMFHAPPPSWPYGIKQACDIIATIANFDQGHGSVIMGDFNVRMDDNVGTVGSNGSYAFSGLAGAGQKYKETLINRQTSLVDASQAFVGMQVDDAFSQPYDKFFFRRNGKTINKIDFNNEGVEELLPDMYNGGDMESYLADVENKATGNHPMGYTDIEHTFIAFRTYVSDHMPILMDITY